MRPPTAPLLAAWLAAFAVTSPTAQQPSNIDVLLSRATTYVADFVVRFSNVVAEERYAQKMSEPKRTRELVSDYLLAKLEDSGDWAAFRDVFQVDGKPVRDRDERLATLFLESPATAMRQAAAIAAEGARHNLVNIGTIDNPLLALALLQPVHRSRFRYISPSADKSMGPDVWQLQYQEFRVPTIIKGDSNRNLPSRGRYWIERETGRILKTELRLGLDSVRLGLDPIQVVTTFKYDDALGINVPIEMTVWYPDGSSGQITGVATYGRFRRFGVTTDERAR